MALTPGIRWDASGIHSRDNHYCHKESYLITLFITNHAAIAAAAIPITAHAHQGNPAGGGVTGGADGAGVGVGSVAGAVGGAGLGAGAGTGSGVGAGTGFGVGTGVGVGLDTGGVIVTLNAAKASLSQALASAAVGGVKFCKELICESVNPLFFSSSCIAGSVTI